MYGFAKHTFVPMWVFNLTQMRYMPVVRHIETTRSNPDGFSVGDSVMLERGFSLLDIVLFAYVTGDWNPMHWDKFYAEGTKFGSILAHGLFTGSLAGTALGAHFPGKGTIYLSQSFAFKAPVKPDDVVTFTATIVSLGEKGRATLECLWTVKGKEVLAGEAVVLLPKS